MKNAEYAAALLGALTPELKKRIERIATMEQKSMSDVILDFLRKGANTPIILGVGC